MIRIKKVVSSVQKSSIVEITIKSFNISKTNIKKICKHIHTLNILYLN